MQAIISVTKEIVCKQMRSKSSREFILLELFCCDYWRIDDDRLEAKRRGGSCAGFADNPYKLICNFPSSEYHENLKYLIEPIWKIEYNE